ncbi:hypothetical protein QQF64_021015 [Cirrhinus molitorella]|uniref:Uncharacterized protein n=1 Tax=Cirrhinus molitorella TaxID=172907 RepID=A0ABR3LAS5_9TELE
MSQALPDAGPCACPLGPFPGNRAWQGPLRGRFDGGERESDCGRGSPSPSCKSHGSRLESEPYRNLRFGQSGHSSC